MPVKRVTVLEVPALLDGGYTYVDVRSIPEFDAGHPAGAYNIPLLHFAPGRGMMPNPEFTAVFASRFAAKDTKVLVGCKTGGRSLRAAEMLAELGYTNVLDVQGGWEGERDMAGRVVAPGWRESNLPVETAAPGRTYDELKK